MRIVESCKVFLALGMVSCFFGMFAEFAFSSNFQDVAELTVADGIEGCESCEMSSATLDNGNIVFAWSESNFNGASVKFKIIGGSTLDNAGAQPTLAVTSGSLNQTSPTVVDGSDGSFSIFWVEDDSSILRQDFTSMGEASSASVELFSRGKIIYSLRQEKLLSGYRVLAWLEENDASSLDLFSVKLNANNSPVSAPSVIDQSVLRGSKNMSVAALRTGGYWFVYEKESTTGYIEIALKGYTKNDKLNREETITESSFEDQIQAHATIMQDGKIFVIWVSQNASSSELHSKVFDGNGKKEGEFKVVSASSGTYYSNPKVQSLKDSSYIVTWREDGLLKGQLYNFKHELLGSEFTLNVRSLLSPVASVNYQLFNDNAISTISEDRFLVSWQEGQVGDSDVFFKVFDHTREGLNAEGAPIADAGPDIVYHGRSTAYLDGSRSVDGQGGSNIRYWWTLLSKPEGSNTSVGNYTTYRPSFYPDKLGEYIFELNVIDNATGNSDQDIVSFFKYNTAPLANAGEDKSVLSPGSAVQLLGRDSLDIDMDSIWYQWSFIQKPEGSSVSFDNSSSRTPRIVPDMRGTYKMRLVASDAWGDSDPAEVTVTIDNQKPVARVVYPSVVELGQEVLLDGSSSYDHNRDPLTYRWIVLSTQSQEIPSIAVPSAATTPFVPNTAGAYRIALIVNDGDIDSVPFEFAINVNEPKEPNNAPIANAGGDIVHHRLGMVIQLDGRASYDSDGDDLTFAWTVVSKPVTSLSALDSSSSHTPRLLVDQIGDYILHLVVSDQESSSIVDEIKVSVVNLPPVAHAGSDRSVEPGETIMLNGDTSSDPNGHQISYLWSVSSGDAVLANANSKNPSFSAGLPGLYNVRLTVTDPEGLQHEDIVVVTVNNTAPTANAGEDQTISSISELISLDGSASFDQNSQTLSYQWQLVSKPAASALSLSGLDQVSVSFTADVYGTYVLELRVNDGITSSVADQVKITVLNQKPVAEAGGDQSVSAVDSLVMLDGSASFDADNQQLTYNWVMESKPLGSLASLQNADKATASFIPDMVGNYRLSLIVSDGNQSSIIDYVRVTVLNQEPVAVAGDDREISGLDSIISVDGSQSYDPEGSELVYIWTLASRPDNSAAELITSDAVITQFTADIVGDYVLNLMVSDGSMLSMVDTVVVSVINRAPEVNEKPTTTPLPESPSMTARDYFVSALTLINQLDSEEFGMFRWTDKKVSRQNTADKLEKRRGQWIKLLEKAITHIDRRALLNTAERNFEIRWDNHTRRLLNMSFNMNMHANGCFNDIAEPDMNDWLVDCGVQQEIRFYLDSAIDILKGE